MVSIERNTKRITVMVIMEVAPADQAELIELALASQRTMAAQPGFIAGALHRGEDGTRVVQYLQWESREAHAACMASPDWNNEDARRFMVLFDSGRATMNVQTYDVIA